MSEDTRRCKVQTLVDKGVTQFALRPLDGPEEVRQEVMVMVGLEALHALPCCDGDVPAPDVEMVSTTDGLRIRSAPVIDEHNIIGYFQAGDHVWVAVDESPFKTITRGAWKGKYVSGAYLKVPQ